MPMRLMPFLHARAQKKKLHFYLKFGFFWVGRARETTNQVEVALLL